MLDQADKADSGEVFAYGGKLYLKQDQTVYAVERRNGQKGDYTSLYDLYMGRSGADEEQEAEAVSGDRKILAEDLPLSITNGPSGRRQVGEPFWYGGKKYVKESDGKYYMIR